MPMNAVSSTASKRLCALPSPDDLDAEMSTHRGRDRERQAKHANLQKLKNAETSRQYWDVLRSFTDDFHQKWAPVTNDSLRRVFEGRLNPPSAVPGHFDPNLPGRRWSHWLRIQPQSRPVSSLTDSLPPLPTHVAPVCSYQLCRRGVRRDPSVCICDLRCGGKMLTGGP